MKLFGKKDKEEERKGKEIYSQEINIDATIGPGETLIIPTKIPIEIIEEAKRQGKSKLIFECTLTDKNGKKYDQNFEFDIYTRDLTKIGRFVKEK